MLVVWVVPSYRHLFTKGARASLGINVTSLHRLSFHTLFKWHIADISAGSKTWNRHTSEEKQALDKDHPQNHLMVTRVEPEGFSDLLITELRVSQKLTPWWGSDLWGTPTGLRSSRQGDWTPVRSRANPSPRKHWLFGTSEHLSVTSTTLGRAHQDCSRELRTGFIGVMVHGFKATILLLSACKASWNTSCPLPLLIKRMLVDPASLSLVGMGLRWCLRMYSRPWL